jgi:CRP/FNR family transcriptional regulator, cyclic AMP receptor protein
MWCCPGEGVRERRAGQGSRAEYHRGRDYFGELVRDGGPRAASIMTLEPCRLYAFPHGDVERLRAGNPEFARDFVRKLIGKVRSLTSRVLDLAKKDVRLVRFLDENAVEAEGRRLVHERLTQSEIAARISVEAKQIILHRKLAAQW